VLIVLKYGNLNLLEHSGPVQACNRTALTFDWLRAGQSRDRIPVGGRFFRTCTMGSGSFPEVKSGRVVTLTLHPFLVPWSRKSRAIPLLLLWVVWPVQSLSACTRMHFSFTFTFLARMLFLQKFPQFGAAVTSKRLVHIYHSKGVHHRILNFTVISIVYLFVQGVPGGMCRTPEQRSWGKIISL